MIEVSDVSLTLGGSLVLDHVSLTLPKGGILQVSDSPHLTGTACVFLK